MTMRPDCVVAIAVLFVSRTTAAGVPCCQPHSTYNSVARDFPLSARQVLENLKLRAQEVGLVGFRV